MMTFKKDIPGHDFVLAWGTGIFIGILGIFLWMPHGQLKFNISKT